MAGRGLRRINFAWGLFRRVWPVSNSKMKSIHRSQGLVNPNQFTDLAIELGGQSWEDGCPTQAADWLFQGLYGRVKSSHAAAPGFVVISLSVDSAQPGRLLRVQGEQRTRIKSSLAADRRVKDLSAKAFRIEAGVPKQTALGGSGGVCGQPGKPACTNTKSCNSDGNQ